MKNSRAVIAMVGIAFVIAIGAMAGRTANAATPTVGLGTAATYSVLAGTPSITNTGATTIDRDVGIHPASSIIGFPPGIIGGTVHAGDAAALQAKSDLTVAYLDAASRPVTANYAALGGLTLVGGVYNSGSAVLDLTGTLTLNGQNDPNSVWVFQAQSSLVTASTSSVVFINGGSPCNVFWQVTSSASLGSGSSFVGTILALTSITLANGVTVQGRALARNGDVTLINDRFITSTCNAAPPVVTPPGTRPPFTVAPSATPAVAPTATPIAAATPVVAPTAAPVAAAAPTAARPVAGTKTLPFTSTGDPFGPLTMLGIAMAGIGILLLRGRPVRHP
ncbi:MAG: ice-binding family protein [Chloroflexota bacterium]|nr:ice-binding family protein [Chloroflexota bacterium]